jgi:Aldo/keto reductases, related to diketogulonate reductase
LGFGVYRITDQKICEESVLEALNVGYRLIDTAAMYMNEEAVGRAIKRSKIPREEIFITSKVWVQDAGYKNTKMAFERSLKRLQVNYLDLYLIHQPYGDVFGSWSALGELLGEGRVRSIGVSNFASDRVMDLIVNTGLIPAINQVETHLFKQQIALQNFLKQYNIQLESWAPFGNGSNNILTNEILRSMGEKYEKSIAQIILRWLIQRNVVAIPKSVHKSRIMENFRIFDFEIGNDDMKSLTSLDRDTSLFSDHRDPATVKRISEMKMNI